MAGTIAGDHPCSGAALHGEWVGLYEQELLLSWQYSLPMRSVWDVSQEMLEPRWRGDGGAVLRTYWAEMPCGCVFGALRVQLLDVAS